MRSNPFSLLLVSLFLLPSFVMAQNKTFEAYKWQTLTCIGEPVARHEAAFVESNGKFYLLGGRRIQPVSIFNPATNTWGNGAKPPIELHHFQGVSYKGDIYAMGVQSGVYPHEKSLPNGYIYKPKTDEWIKGPDMPARRVRGSTGTVVYKNKLYLVCGIINGHWDGHVKWFDSYDFKTGKWDTLPDAPRLRDHFSAVVCNDKLYLISGRVTSGSIKKVFDLTVKEVDVFDFKTQKWSTLDVPVPTQRAGCTSICMDGKIIIAGGESKAQKNAHSEIECLDTRTGEWSTLAPLVEGRHGTQLIKHKKKLYIASGCGSMGGKPELKSIESFSKVDTKTIKALLITGHTSKAHNWQVASSNLKAILDAQGIFETDIALLPDTSKALNFSPDFSKYQVLILNFDDTQWSENTKSNFERYVQNGGGVVVIHEANNAFPEWKEFNEMIGLGGWGKRNEKSGPYYYWKDGEYVKDFTPGAAGKHGKPVPYIVNMRNKKHPVTKGLPVKWLQKNDELYGNLRGPAENIEVLATAFSTKETGGTGKEEPVLFTIRYGKGRIFQSVMGHVKPGQTAAMESIGFQVTFARGVEWAATGKVKQKVPVDFQSVANILL